MARPDPIDAYIAACEPEVRAILERIRRTIRAAAPEATEVISYGMPTFRGARVLLHYGAFRQHIGLFPPVSGDPAIEKALAPYAGEKGNLRFPLDEPIPYALIGRIARLRVRQDRAKAAGTKRKG